MAVSLAEPSPVNPDAPELDGAAISAIRARPELRANLWRGYQRMRKFYEGSRHWVTAGNHNHLRITRILKCLMLTGLEADAREFFAWLSGIYEAEEGKPHPGITGRSYRFWKDAVGTTNAAWMQIETPRLRLRPWIDQDSQPLAAMCADPRVMEFFPSIYSREDTEALWKRIHEHFARYGFGPWAMEVEGEFAGALGLSWISRFETHFTPGVEIGYRLRTEFWGRGLATEGGRAALQFGFERLRLQEIVAFTLPANKRSRRVMEQIGLVFTEEFDHPLIAEGHPMRRQVLYRISRSAWEENSAALTAR